MFDDASRGPIMQCPLLTTAWRFCNGWQTNLTSANIITKIWMTCDLSVQSSLVKPPQMWILGNSTVPCLRVLSAVVTSWAMTSWVTLLRRGRFDCSCHRVARNDVCTSSTSVWLKAGHCACAHARSKPTHHYTYPIFEYNLWSVLTVPTQLFHCDATHLVGA